ncbi:hypothetical protein A8W25_16560 [Streptomyces sp. ERV7]|uniref:hypothetical protein n=1 Tax=Streptomyces sp. ERV7 TaxID=1322334 RepID=UPI0007F5527B|nr:hypothetical protein [Streptomyces sp. ERV7]OAR24073.1 hypothetical protein A8W25_16560 [Streptomyces sp. ERV7]
MAVTDELRNALSPKPLFFVAGALDLGAKQAAKVPEKIPGLVERLQSEVPARIEAVRNTDPKVVQDKVVATAKEAQAAFTAKVNDVVGALDGDMKKLGDSVQHLALQAVGVTVETLVKSRETYDYVAGQGEAAVKKWRGEAAEEILEVAEIVEPKSSEPASEPASEAPADDSAASADAADSSASAEAKPAAAKKTTARRSTAKKTAAKPSE